MIKFNGDALKKKRESKGWTPAKVSLEMGIVIGKPVSPNSVYDWEDEKNGPTGLYLFALTKAFDCSLDDFFCEFV